MIQLIVADFLDFTFLVVVAVAIALAILIVLDEQTVIHQHLWPYHSYHRTDLLR